MSENDDRSLLDILQDIAGNFQRIVRSEVRLAKAEVQEETARTAKSAALLVAGALLGLFAAGFFLLSGLFALENAVAPWLAALIEAAAVGLTAGILLRLGMKRIRRFHLRPERTVQTLREDLEWARNQAR